MPDLVCVSPESGGALRPAAAAGGLVPAPPHPGLARPDPGPDPRPPDGPEAQATLNHLKPRPGCFFCLFFTLADPRPNQVCFATESDRIWPLAFETGASLPSSRPDRNSSLSFKGVSLNPGRVDAVEPDSYLLLITEGMNPASDVLRRRCTFWSEDPGLPCVFSH